MFAVAATIVFLGLLLQLALATAIAIWVQLFISDGRLLRKLETYFHSERGIAAIRRSCPHCNTCLRCQVEADFTVLGTGAEISVQRSGGY